MPTTAMGFVCLAPQSCLETASEELQIKESQWSSSQVGGTQEEGVVMVTRVSQPASQPATGSHLSKYDNSQSIVFIFYFADGSWSATGSSCVARQERITLIAKWELGKGASSASPSLLQRYTGNCWDRLYRTGRKSILGKIGVFEVRERGRGR